MRSAPTPALSPAEWARLMPWLDRALDVPPAEQATWLAQQDLPDDLRAHLHRLLAQRQAMNERGFLQDEGGGTVGPQCRAPAAPSGAPAPAAPGGQPDHAPRHLQDGLFVGDLIGPWRLVRLLGQGGMSVVWLAERDDGQVRRQVALKLPHAGPGQELLAARLRRERDFLAALEHPHIARLYDVGVTPQGLPYMALEYVDGLPLHAYAHQHQLGVTARLQLFLQVLAAVQHAHQQLVLHRDLKPGNILVDAQGQVKLLDFGIAKLIRGTDDPLASGTAPSTELTQHSGQVLTPDYAAPEQIAGQPLTTASDVYALGVVLFELLTGQRPYKLPRGTRGALEDAILHVEPRRPSEVWRDTEATTLQPDAATPRELAAHFGSSPARLAQRLHGDLDVIVAQALQKSPARRYPSAEALAQDIRRHLASEPIAAQPDSRWYRTRKYVRRHAWALSAVAAVVAALGVGLGLALWQAREARLEAAKAKAIQGFLVGLFENGDVEQPDALRKRQQTVQDLLVGSARALSGAVSGPDSGAAAAPASGPASGAASTGGAPVQDLRDQPAVRAELQGVLGQLLHNLSLNDDALAVRRARVQQLQAMGAEPAELAQAWRDLADSQDARGDLTGARDSLNHALQICEAHGMRPAALCWGTQAQQGWLMLQGGKPEDALKRIEPAVQRLRAEAPGSLALAQALSQMGDALSNTGRIDPAAALYDKAMALRAKIWGPQSVRLALERQNLAIGWASQGRNGRALREFRLAEDGLRQALGGDHNATLLVTVQRARLEVRATLNPSSLAELRHAATLLELRSEALSPRTRYEALMGLVEALQLTGDLEGVKPLLVKALALAHTSSQVKLVASSAMLAMAYYLQDVGDYFQSRVFLQQASENVKAMRGPSHPLVHLVADYCGALDLAEAIGKNAPLPLLPPSALGTPELVLLGRAREALTLARRNWDQVKATPADERQALPTYAAADQLGRALAANGRCDQALAPFHSALKTLELAHPNSPYLMVTRARLGLCLLAVNDRHAASLLVPLVQRRLAPDVKPALGPHLTQEARHFLSKWQQRSPSTHQQP